jgi:DNA replication protein DnaC
MAVARGSGSTDKLLSKLKKCDILILDDWGLASLNPLEGLFLLDVLEDRYGVSSTMISAQLPVAKWHGLFEDSTVADAVLERAVHNSHRLELKGPSMRIVSGNVPKDHEANDEHDPDQSSSM